MAAEKPSSRERADALFKNVQKSSPSPASSEEAERSDRRAQTARQKSARQAKKAAEQLAESDIKPADKRKPRRS